MRRWVVIGIVATAVVISAVGIAVRFLPRPAISRSASTVQGIGFYLERLRTADDPQAFLLARVADTPDFMQFRYVDGRFVIEFPLVTRRQRAREQAILASGRGQDLEVTETTGASGHRFLRYPVDPSAEQAHRTAEVFFSQVFSAGDDRRLELEWTGFTAPEP